MLAAAQRTLGVSEDQCCYELAVSNPDKGMLPKDVVQQRAQAFQDASLPLVLTKVCALSSIACLSRLLH